MGATSPLRASPAPYHRALWFRAAAAIGLCVLAIGGCGGEEDPASDSDTTPDSDTASGEVVVEIEGSTFRPADVRVESGSTVRWSNGDAVGHTATSGPSGEPDGSFDLTLDGGGGQGTVQFDEPGSYDYHCSIHPSMTGTVTVTG